MLHEGACMLLDWGLQAERGRLRTFGLCAHAWQLNPGMKL